MELAIHSFETMGTVDGPGLRTVVFLQGCHLRCVYCHNRDMWQMEKGGVLAKVLWMR
ncbi:4Fe-4S cluster-binding domain-containing protein [Chitinivibrio alkaliphilus]|uniref:4Fe-4S cluster-binding domain-containing protein n=1 Tax=Chitinivibrio alkaliphilus TaxID=1505232 RepID=UPI0003FCAEEF|nr:4Fe-4S cluster-binding domain-containing protein [Chitinivibrio alkaliphilus]